MNLAFEKAFLKTVALEGGYSNNPFDSGGETMYGITINVARNNGYTDSMKIMPLIVAKKIYKSEYWDAMFLDSISEISQLLAAKMFDIGVNMGIKQAGLFIQKSLNCAADTNLILDGHIGHKTIKALSLNKMLVDVILKMVNSQQCVKYMSIVEKNPSQRTFIKGWVTHRVS